MLPREETAIDISNYTGDLSERQLEWLRETAAFVIVRLSTEDQDHQRTIAAQQVYALADARIPWQGYLWCYWDMDPFEHWRRATELLPDGWPGYLKAGIWLDMEDPVPRGQQALSWIGAYASLLARDGFTAGVYTGQWWLDQNRAGFEGGREDYWTEYPLWFARYGIPPTPAVAGIHPWTEVAMHQWAAVNQGPVLRSYDVSAVYQTY